MLGLSTAEQARVIGGGVYGRISFPFVSSFPRGCEMFVVFCFFVSINYTFAINENCTIFRVFSFGK